MTDLNRAIERLRSAPLQTQIGEMPEEMRLVIKAAESAPQWINPKDRLPPEGMHNVLMTIEGVMYTVSGIKSSDDKWYDDNGNEILNKVIAWMLTPHPYQPPKPVDPLLLAVEALEQIAKGENLYANQQIAREALDRVKGENIDNTC